MSGVLTEGRNLDTQTGEMPCEDEGRKWRDTPTSQGTQRLLQPPEAWREAENRLPIPALRRNPLHQHSEFRLLRPRTVRPYISVVYALQSVGLSYRRHTLNCTQKGLFVFSKPCSILLPFLNLFGVIFLFTYAYRISHDHSRLAHRWFPCKFCKIPSWNNLLPLSSF